MLLPHEQLISMEFPDQEFTYSDKDTMLYAVGVGMGRSVDELSFVFEKDLQAIPTQAAVIAWYDKWQEQVGLDVQQVVHGEQRVTLHNPLPTQARIRSRFRIQDAFDKGVGRGAVLLVRTELHEVDTDMPLATLLSTVFARGDGGFGGPNGRGPDPHTLPNRQADRVLERVVRQEQAAIYRLSGDLNPLHVDNTFARNAGFDRPILHGLCTWGMAATEVLRATCELKANRLRHFEARFTSPVFPGETLRTEIWIDGEVVSFRTHVVERGLVVLNHGKALITPV